MKKSLRLSIFKMIKQLNNKKKTVNNRILKKKNLQIKNLIQMKLILNKSNYNPNHLQL